MISLLLAWAHAADEPEWDVTQAHGPTHEVELDLDEGTWVSVSVHGPTVVFDLLGDIWTVPLIGGVATRISDGPAWEGQPSFSPDGQRIAFTSDRGGNENIWIMNADGTDPRAFTEEDVARCTHAVWDPTGPYLLYRRRTVDTRSIGVTEVWQKHIEGGDGFALTQLDAHPHAGEPFPTDGPHLYFSSRQGRFSYDQDPVRGLWEVVRLDRTTGDMRPIAHGPGSASRPMVSPDGQGLLFVSRRRAETLLERVDLESGDRTVVADWLSPDELEGFALHGTYPRMDWTDDGRLVLWAQGKLWQLDPKTGNRAEIRFKAQGSWTLHDVARPKLDVPDEVQASVVRWPTLSTRGSWAFSALGALWVRDEQGALHRVSEGSGYAPAWSPDGTELAWTSWTDAVGGALHVTGPDNKTETLPIRGQLTNPAWSADGRSLVVLRGKGGGVSVDTAAEPWYEVVRMDRPQNKKASWSSTVLTSVDARWGSRKQRLRLHGDRLWFLEWRREEPRAAETAVLVSVALDGSDKRDHMTLGEAQEAALSPDLERIAYKLEHQLHVAALPRFARGVGVAAVPSAKVTKVVGDWLGWSPDGTEVTWVEGSVLKRLVVADLWDDPADDEEEEEEDDDEDEDEADPLAEDERVASIPLVLTVPRDRPDGVIVLTNARVITMQGDEVLEGVNVVVEADRIVEIAAGATREGARTIDCAGKTVLPGLVDVHAHMHFSSGDILPEQEWRYQVALDFGVTTVHDPSTLTDLVFTQQDMVAAGIMQGPRILSTGGVLYGALSADNAATESLDDAVAHVRRLAAVGATSVKVYQQSSRTKRQWFLEACRREGVLCVPEGGGDLWMDLGMVVDGYPAMEHSLPTAPLYRDVVELFAASAAGEHGDGHGTFYTPTLQVAYGGVGGQNWFLQHENPVDDPRLRQHFPARQLEAALWRHERALHDDDWRFFQTARDAAAVRAAGGSVTVGAHGELQGLGVHWEIRSLAADGALSNHEALRAATLQGARYVGLDHLIGTVEPGKFADLLVVDGDPLADLAATTDVYLVLKNGRVVVPPGSPR